MSSRPPRISFYMLLPLGLFLIGAGLRLYDLTDQPIDFHPTRQLRGAIVARGLYYQILPGIDEADRRQASAFQDSTGQYEPPILEGLVALTYLMIGQENFWVARLFNTLFWLIGAAALLALARRSDRTKPAEVIRIGALVVLAYYLVLPFGVQASRAFQPDPGMVMWLALAIYALWRWCEAQTPGANAAWRWALAAGAAAGMGVLTKAVVIFPIGGAFAALALYEIRRREKSGTATLGALLRDPRLWTIGLLMIAPAAIYYLTRQGRASEYFSTWTLALSHLLLTPRFYLDWLYLVQQLLHPAALALALAGIWLARGRMRALLAGLWGGYLVYGLFLPYQMNTHNYYHLQLVLLVPLSLLPALHAVARFLLKQAPAWRVLAAAAAALLLAYASWQALIPLYSQDYRHEPAYWQSIAARLPNDGKVIALTQDYGYRLMYYGQRKVTLWPNRGELNLSDLRGESKEFDRFFARRTADKSYFLITAFRQFEDQPKLQAMLNQNYPLLAEGQGYLIFDLTRQKP